MGVDAESHSQILSRSESLEDQWEEGLEESEGSGTPQG